MSNERYRIMVVDDEEDMRSILEMALSGEYEVFSATNGLDAMLKLSRYQPDLAIVDIMMPLMNGLDLARKIRETPGFNDLPIIALSALNARDDIKKGYDAGADLYLTKPFQPDRVLKNVAISLGKRPPRFKDMTIEEVEMREAKLKAKTKRALEKHKAGEQTAHVEPPKAAASAATASQASKPAREKVEEYDSSRFEKATPPVDQKPRLLIVDDDEDFLMVQRALLEEQGYEVVTARDGFDAMNKIPEVQPDLFIIDGMMPRMSGYQLTDLIRGTLETRDRPVIFASAKGSDRDRKMMAQKGVRQYLVKPFENSAMIAAVKEEVDRPGFRISTKRRTIKDILYDEGKRRAAHAATESKQKRWQTISTVEGFLKDNRRKGAFDKD